MAKITREEAKKDLDSLMDWFNRVVENEHYYSPSIRVGIRSIEVLDELYNKTVESEQQVIDALKKTERNSTGYVVLHTAMTERAAFKQDIIEAMKIVEEDTGSNPVSR